MELIDGFIAAIASEFKIKFHKDSSGVYTTTIEFDNNRSQDILITFTNDESGDRIINYYSIVGVIKHDSFELYKLALKLNSTLDYGALALLDDSLILRNTLLLKDCEPLRFVKSLFYIAAKADELEEMFISKNIY